MEGKYLMMQTIRQERIKSVDDDDADADDGEGDGDGDGDGDGEDNLMQEFEQNTMAKPESNDALLRRNGEEDDESMEMERINQTDRLLHLPKQSRWKG